MLFGNAQLYAKARAAKLGRMSLPHPLEQLRHRVSDQFHVTVLYVEFDEIDIGPHEGRTRLNLILETSADYAKLHENPITLRPGVKIAILKSFAEIVAAADLNDHFDTNDVHLIFDDFSDEAMEVVPFLVEIGDVSWEWIIRRVYVRRQGKWFG